MRTRQGIVPGYNAQAMVSPLAPDGEAIGIFVTAVDVVDEANEAARLTPMLKQAEEITGVRTQMTLADAGYFAGRHVEECHRRGQQVTMPDLTRPLDHPYHKDQFVYDEESDSYTCPHGQRLAFVRPRKNTVTQMRKYRVASASICLACPAFGVCTKEHCHVQADGLAHELAHGAVLLLDHLPQLLGHLRGQGEGDGVGFSGLGGHSLSFCLSM